MAKSTVRRLRPRLRNARRGGAQGPAAQATDHRRSVAVVVVTIAVVLGVVISNRPKNARPATAARRSGRPRHARQDPGMPLRHGAGAQSAAQPPGQAPRRQAPHGGQQAQGRSMSAPSTAPSARWSAGHWSARCRASAPSPGSRRPAPADNDADIPTVLVQGLHLHERRPLLPGRRDAGPAGQDAGADACRHRGALHQVQLAALRAERRLDPVDVLRHAPDGRLRSVQASPR